MKKDNILIRTNVKRSIDVNITGMNNGDNIRQVCNIQIPLTKKECYELIKALRNTTCDNCYQNKLVKKIVDIAAQEADIDEIHSAGIYFDDSDIRDLDSIYENVIDDYYDVNDYEQEELY